jgi:haloalkane dehalogenase
MADYQRLYPFTSHWLPLKGATLHYLDEGEPDAPPLVLLHGNPTWSFYWRTIIPEMSRTHRVIVPDHIGCGYSDKPQDYPYTLERHIRNLETLLEQLKLRDVSLMMHDWGGAIGSGYATRHPDNVSSLVVCNTSAFYRPLLYWPIKLSRSALLGDLLVRGLNAFVLGALVMGTSQHRRFTSDIRSGYLAPYRNWYDRVAILNFVRDIPLEDGHVTRKTVDEIERRLVTLRGKPMLVLWGADDPVFTIDTFLAGWKEHFPDAQVHILQKAGHYVIEDAHERILPLLKEFLK